MMMAPGAEAEPRMRSIMSLENDRMRLVVMRLVTVGALAVPILIVALSVFLASKSAGS
jgi:hypothetical protein